MEEMASRTDLHALEGTTYVVAKNISVSVMMVDRFRALRELIQQEKDKIISEDDRAVLKKYNKYFQNKRKTPGTVFPSVEECRASTIGYACGVIMDTTDPETMWAMFDIAADPDPASTTGHEGTSQQGNVDLPSINTASHPSGTPSNQPARPSSSMDSLSLLALAAWTDEGNEQLLTALNQRLDSSLLCLGTCSEAVSKAMGEFMERQHHANQQWLLALQTGRAAYDALASATSISREFNQLRNAHMVLQHEFLDCLTRHRVSRKRGRDE